jgi:hypothetical protein
MYIKSMLVVNFEFYIKIMHAVACCSLFFAITDMTIDLCAVKNSSKRYQLEKGGKGVKA